MSKKKPNKAEIITRVDDEVYGELAEMVDQKILSFVLWEESLSDELENIETSEEEIVAADIDLYLEGGVYFELYGAVSYPKLTDDPLQGASTIHKRLSTLISKGVWLDEVAVDEHDQLVLVLSQQHQPVLFLAIGGWVIDMWDELPEN